MCGKIPFNIWLSRWKRSLWKGHILLEYHVFLNYFLLIFKVGENIIVLQNNHILNINVKTNKHLAKL